MSVDVMLNMVVCQCYVEYGCVWMCLRLLQVQCGCQILASFRMQPATGAHLGFASQWGSCERNGSGARRNARLRLSSNPRKRGNGSSSWICFTVGDQ
jgi:hypothetical protein